MINKKLAIFDLDGVIVDTAKYHYLAWRVLADKLGVVFTEVDNERLKGVSRMESLEILLEIGGLTGKFTAEEKLAMAQTKNDIYTTYIEKITPEDLLEGTLECLNACKAKGIKVALGSASKNAKPILERLEITNLFDVIGDGLVVEKAKPDPAVFLYASNQLGISPEDCIVFEDAYAGIEAAHRANMYAVGIGDKQVLYNADEVIRNLGEVKL